VVRRQTVTSIFHEIEKVLKGDYTLKKRLILLLIALTIQLIYLPASSRTYGGIEPRLPIDVFPIWAIWVVPYVLCYPLWLAGAVWAIFTLKDRWYKAFVTAVIVTFSIGALTFIFFPTYVPEATLVGDDIFTSHLRSIHESWGRYAALPSGHIYITTLLALFLNRMYPRYGWVWLLSVLIVSLSTLFTGQHYILDVVTGYMAALAGYYAGLWWAGFYARDQLPHRRPVKRLPTSSTE
jgi:membrane-associated phospholipid phosphatase